MSIYNVYLCFENSSFKKIQSILQADQIGHGHPGPGILPNTCRGLEHYSGKSLFIQPRIQTVLPGVHIGTIKYSSQV